MDEDNRNIITVVFDLVAAYVARINDLIHLAALEAQLAVKTLMVMGVLLFFLASLLTATWLSILVLLFVYLLSIHYTLLGACLCIVAINFLAILGIAWVFYRLKENLFFPATREQLGRTADKEILDARITKED